MIRLAIDTSCAPSSLALSLSDSQKPIMHILDKDKEGAEHIICEIGALVDQAGLDFHHLDEIIVARGPGPFIGLRIGLAAARGIGLAAQLPVKGASTLTAFAATASADADADSIIMALAPATSQRIISQFFYRDFSPASPMRITHRDDFEICLPQNKKTQSGKSGKIQKIHFTGPLAHHIRALPAFSAFSSSLSAVMPATMSAVIVPMEKKLAAILLTWPPSCLSAPPEPLYPPS